MQTMRASRFFSFLVVLVVAAVAAVDGRAPPSDLEIQSTFLPPDCSVKAKPGDRIKVHYTGTLFSNGNKFDSSLDRGDPLPLTLGAGQVIRGWDEGLVGMCLHEKRQLVIPAHKAYGSRGFGSIIPANSALVFDVELVGLESTPDHREL